MSAYGDDLTISIVIPARDAASTLGSTLDAIATQKYGGTWEVIVADNGSTDGTGAIVEARAPLMPVRRVDASERPGASHARNVGAATASGDVLVFCDADDVPAPGWLSALAAAARGADLVGGRLDYTTMNPARARHPDTFEDNDSAPVLLRFLPHAVGGNVAIRRDVFEAIGGWNEDFGVGEDIDLSWRAQLAGHSLAFARDAVVYCRRRERTRDGARQQYAYGRALVRLYHRFLPYGVPRTSIVGFVAKGYARLIVRTPLLLSRHRRAAVVYQWAYCTGMLRGTVSRAIRRPQRST